MKIPDRQGNKMCKGSWPWPCAERWKPWIWMDGDLRQGDNERGKYYSDDSCDLPPLTVTPFPPPHPPQPLFPAPRKAVVLVAFMVFSPSKSTEDKRPLCWKLVPHRVTTVLKVLKNTWLLFISITAFAKLLSNLLGGTGWALFNWLWESYELC